MVLYFLFVFTCLLSLYRNRTDFCGPILYTMTLLNLFINCRSYFVDCLGFSLELIMSYTKRQLISSFPICMLFLSFPCLNAVVELPVQCWVRVATADILFCSRCWRILSFTINYGVSCRLFGGCCL